MNGSLQHGRQPKLPDGMSIADAQALLDSMYWHHSIDFGGGLVSKGATDLSATDALAAALLDGLNLSGKTLFDIGAWNGAYSFEAKRRGAARVIASDKFVWTDATFKGRQTFDLAQKLTGLEIEIHEIDVPFITTDTVGIHDVVLFSGVFYHLINAVHLTRQISSCARHVLIVETHQDALDSPRPAMVFYPGATLNGDISNWWGPNPHCMYELLTEFGFAQILYRDTPGHGGHGRGIYQAFRDAQSMIAMGITNVNPPWVCLSIPEARGRLFGV